VDVHHAYGHKSLPMTISGSKLTAKSQSDFTASSTKSIQMKKHAQKRRYNEQISVFLKIFHTTFFETSIRVRTTKAPSLYITGLQYFMTGILIFAFLCCQISNLVFKVPVAGAQKIRYTRTKSRFSQNLPYNFL